MFAWSKCGHPPRQASGWFILMFKRSAPVNVTPLEVGCGVFLNAYHKRSCEYKFEAHAFFEHITRFPWGCNCWEKNYDPYLLPATVQNKEWNFSSLKSQGSRQTKVPSALKRKCVGAKLLLFSNFSWQMTESFRKKMVVQKHFSSLRHWIHKLEYFLMVFSINLF